MGQFIGRNENEIKVDENLHEIRIYESLNYKGVDRSSTALPITINFDLCDAGRAFIIFLTVLSERPVSSEIRLYKFLGGFFICTVIVINFKILYIWIELTKN